jgi:cell division protein FtsN
MNTDMNRRGEAGFEFVLDNRKLILAFFLLIVVCGGFFVIGFVEGKRQVVNAGPAAPGAGSVSEAEKTEPGETAASPADAGSAQDAQPSVREQLDWYKRVNKADGTRGLEPAPDPARAVVEPPEGPKPSSGGPAAEPPSRLTANKSYSVQVGAFRQRREAEAKAALLKKKGYDCTIEPPVSEGQLFLLKVGKYDSRPEAHTVQLRLKRDGFASFIKTNP